MQGKRWIFTLNNFTAEELIQCQTFVSEGKATYIVFQHELGSEGTRHLQGYVRFGSNKRLASVRRLLDRAHWETARGTHDQCVEYCTKVETRQAGPWEFGEAPHGRGKRRDLDELADAVRGGATDRELARDRGGQFIRFFRGIRELRQAFGLRDNRGVSVQVYIGKTGVGKTWRCYEEEAYHGGEIYRPVVTEQKVWFDGYQGEKGILFDDWVGTGSVAWFLQVLDIYPLCVEVKGGIVQAKWERVYITSNLDIPNWWQGQWSPGHYQALSRRLTRVEYM